MGGGRAWTPEAPPPASGDEAVIADARRLLAEDRPTAAWRLVDPWIERNDGRGNPLLAEALLLRADALLARGLEFDSLYDYERVIREFPGSPSFATAVERELDIALTYLDGLRKRFLGVRIIDASDIAVELLIRVQERMPGSALAERAAIELADYYYREREMELARDAYEIYLENFPRGPNAVHAERRLIYADIARFKGPRYDASGLEDARVRIRNFAARYPAEADRAGINEGLVARIDESQAAQLLDSAAWYAGRGDEPAARYTLRRLVRAYPETIAAAEALRVLRDRGWGEPAEAGDAGDAAPVIDVEGPGAERVVPLPTAADNENTGDTGAGDGDGDGGGEAPGEGNGR